MNMHTIPSFDIRNAFRDPRAVHFQDDIRRAMLKARAPGQGAVLPPSQHDKWTECDAPRVPSHAENCRTVLHHLETGEDSRSGLSERTGIPERTLDRVLLDLRNDGHIVRRRRDRAALYCIAPAGVQAISAPPPVVLEAPRRKKVVSADRVDTVFHLLSQQPATRTAIQRALKVGASTVEDCLRALRLQELIIWVRCPKTNVKTYMVKP